eukprot:m.335576 g.335576  ORF g.335576 m.335576 type:complete len:132 (+) comp17631_c0_seq1:229-624(+)
MSSPLDTNWEEHLDHEHKCNQAIQLSPNREERALETCWRCIMDYIKKNPTQEENILQMFRKEKKEMEQILNQIEESIQNTEGDIAPPYESDTAFDGLKNSNTNDASDKYFGDPTFEYVRAYVGGASLSESD